MKSTEKPTAKEVTSSSEVSEAPKDEDIEEPPEKTTKPDDDSDLLEYDTKKGYFLLETVLLLIDQQLQSQFQSQWSIRLVNAVQRRRGHQRRSVKIDFE